MKSCGNFTGNAQDINNWHMLQKYTFNSSPPSVAYMRQWIGPTLVQIMAFRLFGDKPLPEPMLLYCQLDHQEQTSVKFESGFYHFHWRKCIWKCCLPEWRPFLASGRWVKSTLPYLPGDNELIHEEYPNWHCWQCSLSERGFLGWFLDDSFSHSYSVCKSDILMSILLMGCHYCDSYGVGMFSVSLMASHNRYWQMFAEICDQLVMYSGCTCIVDSHRHPEIDSSMAFIDFWRIPWVPDSLSSGVWSNFTCI